MTRPHFFLAFLYACLGVAFSACMPRVEGLGPAIAAPAITTDQIIAQDGRTLSMRTWQAAAPRAQILALHGFNDYSHAFEDFGNYMSDQGINVYAYDQRGFGKTPTRGIWPGQAALVSDARSAIDLLKENHPDLPLFLLGESMGGAVALLTLDDLAKAQTEAKTHLSDIEGVILVAPAVWGWSSMNDLYATVLWVTAHTLPAQTLTGRGLKIVATDNRKILEEMSRDPLMIKGTRIDAIYGLVELMEAGARAAHEIKRPTLLLYGLNDQVIPGPAIADAFEKALSEEVNSPNGSATSEDQLRAVLYPGGYHMLLRDLSGKQVWQDIESFAIKRDAVFPSGHETDSLEILKKLPKPE